jgi:hypothetical protein
VPSKKRKGEEIAAADTAVAMKIASYIAMKNRDMTAVELPRRLNVDYREAQRVFHPHHLSSVSFPPLVYGYSDI